MSTITLNSSREIRTFAAVVLSITVGLVVLNFGATAFERWYHNKVLDEAVKSGRVLYVNDAVCR